MRKRLSSVLSRVLATALALIMIFACIGFVQAQTPIAPDNPIDELIERTKIPVAEAATLAVDEEILDQDTDVTDAESNLVSDIATASDYTPTTGASGGSGGSYTLPSDEPYFTTTIEDGKRIDAKTEPDEYSFEIRHLRSELEPKSIVFYQNGEVSTTFSGTPLGGSFTLKRGVNEVYFDITYEVSNGSTQTVRSRVYTLYYTDADKDIIITVDPNLDGKTVNSPTYYFSVSTNPEEAEVEVKHGNSRRTGGGIDGRYYTVYLTLGKNIITIQATCEGRNPETKTMVVYYELKDGLQIVTNLDEFAARSPLTNSEIEFYAYVTGALAPVSFEVRKGTVLLSPTRSEIIYGSDGEEIEVWYFKLSKEAGTQLGLGKNTFSLVANDFVQVAIEETHYVTYTRDPNEQRTDGKTPTLYTNVTNGQTIANSPFSLQLSAINHLGQTIYQNGIYVYLNGVLYRVSESMAPRYYYHLPLNVGENTIQITLRDYDEYYFNYYYNVYYDPSTAGQQVGTVSISVEATTVGLGVLASGSMPIYSGEPVSHAVVHFLEQNGYTCTALGKVSSGFYLQHINRVGITNGCRVPEALLSELTSTLPGAYHGNHYTDSLGENDFTSSSSGWMITINGSTISGLSNVHPSDGDVIRIRYTLAGGRDIGLASGSNFSQEW